MHGQRWSWAWRALVVLMLAGAGLVMGQSPALACSCAPGGDLERYAAQADAVFSATVTTSAPDTVGTGKQERRVRRYTADVDRIYQGNVTATPVVITSAVEQSACGLGRVPTGRPWVFFVNGRGTRFFGNTCGGSHEATAGYVGKVEETLGAGQVLVDPVAAPPPLEYTDVDVSDPTALGRLVAPGAAIAIVGLLGLALVRRRASGRD